MASTTTFNILGVVGPPMWTPGTLWTYFHNIPRPWLTWWGCPSTYVVGRWHFYPHHIPRGCLDTCIWLSNCRHYSCHSSLMDTSCWSILVSRDTVPILLPVRKPCRTSWKSIAIPGGGFKIAVTVFHRTSIIPIPWNLPLPFGIIMTVFQMNSSVRRPSQNSVWIRSTTLIQLVA